MAQSIIDKIENSDYIQALKQEFADAQAAGASQEQLLAIHARAQSYREANGYTANLDGSQYTVIESYTDNVERVKASNNNNTTKLIESSAAAANLASLNIDGDKLVSYAKYGLVGLIIIAILDRIL